MSILKQRKQAALECHIAWRSQDTKKAPTSHPNDLYFTPHDICTTHLTVFRKSVPSGVWVREAGIERNINDFLPSLPSQLSVFLYCFNLPQARETSFFKFPDSLSCFPCLTAPSPLSPPLHLPSTRQEARRFSATSVALAPTMARVVSLSAVPRAGLTSLRCPPPAGTT